VTVTQFLREVSKQATPEGRVAEALDEAMRHEEQVSVFGENGHYDRNPLSMLSDILATDEVRENLRQAFAEISQLDQIHRPSDYHYDAETAAQLCEHRMRCSWFAKELVKNFGERFGLTYDRLMDEDTTEAMYWVARVEIEKQLLQEAENDRK